MNLRPLTYELTWRVDGRLGTATSHDRAKLEAMFETLEAEGREPMLSLGGMTLRGATGRPAGDRSRYRVSSDQVREVRRRAGRESQRRIARDLGISPAYVSKIARGVVRSGA